MIDRTDILRIARKHGFPAGTIEKEYMLTVFLREIAKFGGFVFKGGTALSKVYPDYYRISEDLDFTYAGSGLKEAEEAIRTVCRNLDLDIKDENETSNSYNAEIKFVGPLQYLNNIKIDVSIREKPVFEPNKVRIKTFYADIEPFTVNVFDLREIVSEKIRALMQRSKPRDYFDIWFLLKNKKFDAKEIRTAVIEKCNRIGIKYDPEKIFSDTETLRKQWKTDLIHLVRELPDFDAVISDLKKELAFLKE